MALFIDVPVACKSSVPADALNLGDLEIDIDAEILASAPGFATTRVELDEALEPDADQRVVLTPK